MSISALITEAREDFLDDAVAPYLWSDQQLTRFANEAILEACCRAPLLKRVSTVSIVSGTAEYNIDTSIRQITLAKLDLVVAPLAQTTDADLSMSVGSAWRTHTGTPRQYVRTGHKLRLYPAPIANDTLVLSTSNVPDDNFDIDDNLDSAYHKGLVWWMAYKALMLKGYDTYDPVKAAEYLAMFERKFGIRHSAKYDTVSTDMPMYATISSGRMC